MHVFDSGEDHDAVGESALNQEVESIPVKQGEHISRHQLTRTRDVSAAPVTDAHIKHNQLGVQTVISVSQRSGCPQHSVSHSIFPSGIWMMS